MSQDPLLNRLNFTFQEKKEGILSVYFTAGFPELHDTGKIVEWLESSGADLVEVGIPFSDPIADGPTIQESNQRALENGMTLRLLFNQLQEIRQVVNLPILLMGYFNPIYQFGMESFCQRCSEVGVDGVIIPDLPVSEYVGEYQKIFHVNGLHNIFLISPTTSESRIREIDEISNAFIYAVSSSSTTGAKGQVSTGQTEYFQRLNRMGLKNPFLVGFGISNRETFDQACRHSAGAIIGSAFIDLVGRSNHLEQDIESFISDLKR